MNQQEGKWREECFRKGWKCGIGNAIIKEDWRLLCLESKVKS